MTDALLPIGDGHTPLSVDEAAGLRLTYVTTLGELNEAETANIVRAYERTRPTRDRLLQDRYLCQLHSWMFGDVWDWAGRYRLRETNIGWPPEQIVVGVRELGADARWWPDDADHRDRSAVRLHHRLVAIHPFPNGNGRHARRVADLFVLACGGTEFSWGAGLSIEPAELRARYLAALRTADVDGEDLDALVAFARS